jgi:hypothetical protein
MNLSRGLAATILFLETNASEKMIVITETRERRDFESNQMHRLTSESDQWNQWIADNTKN